MLDRSRGFSTWLLLALATTVGTRRTQAVSKDADPPPASQAKKRGRPRKTQPELTATTGATPKSSSVPLPGTFTPPIGIAGMTFMPQTTTARSGILVVLVHLRPMFGHPFLSEVLNLAVFNPSIRNPLPAWFKISLTPYPYRLSHMLALCLLKGRCDTFTSDTYSPIFIEYLALLTEFQEDNLDNYQGVLESLLVEGSLGDTQEAVCTNKRTCASGGLLQDTFDKELLMLRPILPFGLSVVTSGIAINAALGSGASASYVNTTGVQNLLQEMPYGYPTHVPCMRPPPGSLQKTGTNEEVDDHVKNLTDIASLVDTHEEEQSQKSLTVKQHESTEKQAALELRNAAMMGIVNCNNLNNISELEGSTVCQSAGPSKTLDDKENIPIKCLCGQMAIEQFLEKCQDENSKLLQEFHEREDHHQQEIVDGIEHLSSSITPLVDLNKAQMEQENQQKAEENSRESQLFDLVKTVPQQRNNWCTFRLFPIQWF
ncbi:hypothetical protein M422DRAFT_268081 [Sphaerobolus stellatus SS14]|uniref:Uncharacterized protein n=1 Tax=Sphaerobolus stellatus (strain SS14) TaxID=990650 RepID=A0A0C9UNK7_SPHS4|nr:hypothetical protein M422DRAFT_268081 [Sphaerobolus stellatus SS14]